MMKFGIFVLLVETCTYASGFNLQCFPNQSTRFTTTKRLHAMLRDLGTSTPFYTCSGDSTNDIGLLVCAPKIPMLNTSYSAKSSVHVVNGGTRTLSTPQCNLDDFNETVVEGFGARLVGGPELLSSVIVQRTALNFDNYNSSYQYCDVVRRQAFSVDVTSARLCKQLQFRDVAYGVSEPSY